MTGLKIKLLEKLPVVDKHGCTKGRIFEARMQEHRTRNGPLYWIMGDAGESVGVFEREAEIVNEAV